MDNALSFSAGDTHSMVVKTDGSLWAFGNNHSRQLGDGTYANKIEPALVMEDVAVVKSGCDYNMAITTHGSLHIWGGGFDISTLYKIRDNVIDVAGVNGQVLTVFKSGILWKQSVTPNLNNFRPSMIMDNVVAVAAGLNYDMAIKSDRTLWSWENDYSYNPGYGTSNEIIETSKVMDDVLSISTNGFHSLAIKTDGSLWTWGSNINGELGCGTPFTEKPVPIHTQFEQTWNIIGCISNGLTDKVTSNDEFEVGIKGFEKGTNINSDGTYILVNVPVNKKGYTIRISKKGYLSREIENIIVGDSDVNVGSKDSPIVLWAGDINQDDCINMADVVEMAKYFNTNSKERNFGENYSWRNFTYE